MNAGGSATNHEPGAGTGRIFLARHAQSVLNALDRVQGWADSPLTEAGRASATALGEGLRGHQARLSAVYCADMMRHRQTAELAIAAIGVPLTPVTDARLREIYFGTFEGARGRDLRAALDGDDSGENEDGSEGDEDEGQSLLTALAGLPAMTSGSGLIAEQPSEVGRRMLASLVDATVRAEKAGGDVLVISSGLSIICALAEMGADLAPFARGIDNAGMIVLTSNSGVWTVSTENEPATR